MDGRCATGSSAGSPAQLSLGAVSTFADFNLDCSILDTSLQKGTVEQPGVGVHPSSPWSATWCCKDTRRPARCSYNSPERRAQLYDHGPSRPASACVSARRTRGFQASQGAAPPWKEE